MGMAGEASGGRSRFNRGVLGASLLLLLLVSRGTAADLELYRDDAASSWSQMDRIHADPAAAFAGSEGLRVEPTYWHKPLLRIAEGRTDFRPYQSLEFWIRAASGTATPTFWLWDYASGTQVEVSDYVEGGVVDTQWRPVSIPMNDLASAAFPLDSVFCLTFGPMNPPRTFYVDDLVLRDVSVPVLLGYELRSDRALTVRVDALDHSQIGSPGDNWVTSSTDPAYLTPVQPVDLGSDRQAIGVTPGGVGVETESRLHLLLPTPLSPGHEYQVHLGGLVGPSGAGLPDPTLHVQVEAQRVSGSIKVNQVGYAPSARKRAVVGNWLGDLGPLPVDTPTFTVVDEATGQVALTGSLTLRAAADPLSGEDVHEADFSALTTPGSYHLEVPGLGRSYSFEIAHDVYDAAYRTVLRLFYHKRNSSLVAPFADPGHERPGIDPARDGAFHSILATYPLSVGEVPGAHKAVSGGWYDAGDYGQYIHNAAPVWATIGLAFDLAPSGHFPDGELNIPESGNGIPDLLDELGWGMDWALSMQDPTDGGVYWRICSATWDLGMPADVTADRLVYEKTTRATAQFAAMAALYSRLIQPHDATRATSVLTAARAAWAYLGSHPDYPAEGVYYQNPSVDPGGGEYATNSSRPAQLWAAAELYRTTGEVAFQDAYRSLLDEVSLDVTAAPKGAEPFWAMALSQHPNRDPVLAEEARRYLMTAADTKLDWAAQNSYRVPKHPHIPYTGWGNFASSPIWALPLLQASYLSGEPVYRELAWELTGAMLGVNPQNQSYLVGIGAKSPQDPMCRLSLGDGVAAPLAGQPVPGPSWHLPAYREPFLSLNQAYYPPELPVIEGDYAHAYPVLRRWTDGHDLIPMNEPTVREEAYVGVALGLLRDDQANPSQWIWPYDWTPGSPKSSLVVRLSGIPLPEVPLLTAAQLGELGSGAVDADPTWLAALSATQVSGIQAPAVPYWVGKLSEPAREGLTAAQIEAFQTWSLFTALPASKVPLVPVAAIPSLGLDIGQTSEAWRQALTPEQVAALTPAQLQVLGW